jgi:16S rRNA (guanine966-N2)-methyltransferase
VRIVGGTWRGRPLAALGKGAPSEHLRPTADRVRESLFNVIEHGAHGRDLGGLRVLDLFAGTGALGLEALSRGAAAAVFVDTGRAAGRLIRTNIGSLGAAAQLVARDARRIGANPDAPFDLVFLDPPYGQGLGAEALDAAQRGGWIAPGALVVWEDNAPQPAPEGFRMLDTRRYGDTHVTFLEAAR